jgi:hypothetical protein
VFDAGENNDESQNITPESQCCSTKRFCLQMSCFIFGSAISLTGAYFFSRQILNEVHDEVNVVLDAKMKQAPKSDIQPIVQMEQTPKSIEPEKVEVSIQTDKVVGKEEKIVNDIADGLKLDSKPIGNTDISTTVLPMKKDPVDDFNTTELPQKVYLKEPDAEEACGEDTLMPTTQSPEEIELLQQTQQVRQLVEQNQLKEEEILRLESNINYTPAEWEALTAWCDACNACEQFEIEDLNPKVIEFEKIRKECALETEKAGRKKQRILSLNVPIDSVAESIAGSSCAKSRSNNNRSKLKLTEANLEKLTKTQEREDYKKTGAIENKGKIKQVEVLQSEEEKHLEILACLEEQSQVSQSLNNEEALEQIEEAKLAEEERYENVCKNRLSKKMGEKLEAAEEAVKLARIERKRLGSDKQDKKEIFYNICLQRQGLRRGIRNSVRQTRVQGQVNGKSQTTILQKNKTITK